MRVACVQMRSGVDIDVNLEAASGLIRKAAEQGATFIATPEMTNILQRSPKQLFIEISQEPNAREIPFFASLAKKLEVDLLIGSMAIKLSDNHAANRSYLFGPEGQVKARYDKIHMFDVTVSKEETWKESNVYRAGHEGVTANIEGTKLGLSVCYDVRFPSLYRSYAQAGVHILTVPAAFTRPTGKAHWETLLRARAIETGSFVMAPAQGGKHEDGRATWGHSMIIGPWGNVRAHLETDNPGIILADIDLEDVKDARKRIPAWQHNAEYSL